MLSNDEKYNILHDSAKEIGIDSHIFVADKKSDLHTQAEFYIERETACVTFTARWEVGNSDLTIYKFNKAIDIINKMLETMQLKINVLIN